MTFLGYFLEVSVDQLKAGQFFPSHSLWPLLCSNDGRNSEAILLRLLIYDNIEIVVLFNSST